MKRFCLLGVMFCVSVFTCSVYAQTPSPQVQPQIEAVITEMTRAAHAHDTEHFMTAYRRSPALVFVIDGRVIHGWNALHAQQLKWWRNGKSDVVYTKSAPTEFMQIAPDVWVTTETLSSRRTGPDGKPAVGSFAVTSIWRKYADGWRIVYGHESWAKPSG